MRLFDTHCHFETDDAAVIAATLKRAREAGVEKVMAVGGSEALNRSVEIAAELSRDRDDLPEVLTAFGWDRDQAGVKSDLEEIEGKASDGCAAWGEIGLDYHYSPETRDIQIELFSRQLEAARNRDLPVVIHTREADDDTLAILREIPSRGIIHSFTGTPDFAKKLLNLGFYVSISGIVTFRSADNVRETVRAIPDERILIETDSPFLAPVPMRGCENEPAFVGHTCRFLAEQRGMSVEAFAELTFRNGVRALGAI